MKMLKMSLFMSMLIAICYIGNANAYTISITNDTDEAIRVDPWGWGVPGGSLMQAKIKHILGWKIWSTHVAGKTIYYKQAGANPDLVYNKPIIQPGATAVLEFTDILDAGLCFDWGGFKVGLASQGYSMISRSVSFVSGEAMQQIMSGAQEITGGIAKAGEAGEAFGAKGKAVGEALKGLSQIANSAIKVATQNGCGNRSAVIVKDIDATGKFNGVVKAYFQQG